MTPSQDQRPDISPPPPDSDQIIEHLERFRPNPGPGLRARIAEAPWAAGLQTVQHEHTPGFRQQGLYAMATALVVVLLAVVFVSTPVGRAAAAQLARYFQRSDSDFTRITVQLPLAQGNQESFPLTLAEAAILAGYPIWLPDSTPANLLFNGARYDPHRDAVVQDYSSNNRLEVLRISQRALGDQEHYTRVGGSAQVEPVSLGEVTAEYVSGSWKLQELPPLARAVEAPSAEIEVTATWDPAAQVQLLRWQQEGYLFEILYLDGSPSNHGNMTKTMLVDLARGLRP